MNPITPTLLQAAQTYPDFKAEAEKNQDLLETAEQTPVHTGADLAFLRRLPPQQVVAIAEDWCPDVVHTLPTWHALTAELDGWQLHVYPRDRHPTLMDTFLYKGTAKRIPVYAFYDERGYLQTWWSGRGAEAQEAVDDWLAGKSFADLGDEEKQKIGEQLNRGYVERFRRSNLDEILDQLACFHHLRRA